METHEITLIPGVWTVLNSGSTGAYTLQNRTGNPISVRFVGSAADVYGYTVEPGMGMSSTIFGEGELEALGNGVVAISY